MTRTPARITQADVARSIRAAQQTGAGIVEIRPDGTILIHVKPENTAKIEKSLEPEPCPPL
jgi:hypothetical protein